MFEYQEQYNPTSMLLFPRTRTTEKSDSEECEDPGTNRESGDYDHEHDLETSLEVKVGSDKEVDYTFIIPIECDVEILD